MSVDYSFIKVRVNGTMVYVNLEDTYLDFLPYDLRKKIQNYLSNAYLKTCFLKFKKTPQYLKDHLYSYAKRNNYVINNIPIYRLLDVINGYTYKWLYMAKNILTLIDLTYDDDIRRYLHYIFTQFSQLSVYDDVRITNLEFNNYENALLYYMLLYRKMGHRYLTIDYIAFNEHWWKDLSVF